MTVTNLPLPSRDDSWRLEALCAQVDPELWFPEHGASEEAREARRICAQCPVRTSCLQSALDTGEQYGLWGGENMRTYRARLGRAS